MKRGRHVLASLFVSRLSARAVVQKEECLPSADLNYDVSPRSSMRKTLMCNDILIPNSLREHSALFDVRFSRCRHLLYFVARRVLGHPETVEEAVQSCYLAAFRNPPEFENQGAFTSWLLRILIDEALVILREKKSGSTISLGNDEE
jgi:hypothetical protein